MATNPTVVVGSLNDEEIKKTIDSLVEHVNKGMEKIVSNTNSAVDNMKNKLRELGTFKVDSSGTADGGSTRRIKALKDETQARKQLVQTLDQQATGIQNVVAPKSASDSYQAIINNMRQNVAALAHEIKNMPNMSLDRQFATYMQYERQIEQVRNRIAELRQELNNAGKDPNASRLVIKQITDEIVANQQRIVQLEREQVQATNQIASADSKALANKQAQYEKERQELVQLSAGQREVTTFTEKQAQNQSRVVDLGTEQLTQSREQLDAQAKIYDARNEQMMQQTRSAQLTQEELDFERQLAEMRAKKGYGNFSDTGKARSAQETNELRGAIAGLLGVQEKEIQIVNVQDASYQQLSAYLGQLKKAYQQLDQEGMNASHGRMLADEIQRVSKGLDDMQRSMMRPTSLKNAMGLDEKSLDDIAYKLQQLAAYRSSLNLTDPKQKEEFDQITQKLKELGKERDKLIGGNDKWIKSNNAVARSLNYIKNRLAFYLTVGASMSFVKQIIETRAQYEMLERSLGILIDSAQRGTEIFREMQQMALISPFTTVELADAAKQLVAYDIAAKDVVDTTRRLGDIAAAVGIPIERMTYALGQIKSYGYMTSINTRMFTRAGIPIVQGLADYYTQLEGRLVSMGDVLDRVKKRAVSYNDVMAVMQSMTDEGGKFFDYQAKMAETLKIQLANLNLAWQNMLNDMGEKYQSFISTSIKVTKELLLHWRDLDTVLNSVGWTYVVTLGASIIRQKGILIGQQMIVEKLAKAWKDLRIAIVKATQWVMANPWTAAITVALAATIGTIVEYNQALEENRKLTKSLSDDAKEAADSLNKYLKARENMVNRTKAQGGKLNTLESEKAWESIRAEIEKSADSAPELITDLMRITDLNERVSAAFDMVERIEDANNKLSELTSKLKITHDVWGGFFGEGLAEDLEDLTEAYEKAGEKWTKIVEINYGGNGRLGGTRYETRLTVADDLAEAKAEVENFAKDAADLIRTELEDGVSDPVQVREAVKRIIKEVEKNNPQIRDAGKDFFESYFSVLMGNEFKDVFDPLEIQWNRFIKILKSNSSSLFRNLSDEILEEGKDLTDTQKEAIKKAFDELGSTLPPEFASLFNDMQRQINENPLIIRYKLLEAFDVEVRNAWQKAFDTDFLTPPSVLDDNAREEEKNRLRSRFFDLRMKQDETRLQYEKRLQDAEKDNKEQLEQTTYSLTQRLSQISQEEAATDALVLSLREEQKEQQQLAQDIDNVQKAMMLRDKEDKKSKSGSKKDVLGDALSKEIQLINNVQSRFKDYQKMGVGANEAIARATEDYGAALDVINRNLAKFGMRTLSANELANMDLRNVRDLMRSQLDLAKRLGNEKGVQALSDAITNINKEIASIDYKRITDGLNNELSKLKDEYELAVELDANPELGNMFMDMFNLDSSDFPKTIDEYMQRVQQVFDKTSKEMKYDAASLDVFTATKDDWEEWGRILGLSEEALKSFSSKFIDAQGVAKKWAQDIVKQTQDLQYKLADTNGKIAIEEEKLQRLKQQYAEETNERQRQLLDLQIRDQEEAIDKLKASLLSELPAYRKLFNSIVDYSSGTTNRLAKNYLRILNEAKKRGDIGGGRYEVRDGGVVVPLTRKELDNQIKKTTAEIRKSEAVFQKIKLAFKGGEDAEKDFTKGLELVAQEAKKAADGIHTIADIVGYLGGEDADEAVETLNDIATTIEGVATAAEGVAQIQNGDIIGGAVNVIKGTWQAVSTWLDNSDKKITKRIKDSERSVKGLELAYKDLQNAMEDAYGYEEVAIKRATIANKQLQLAELERQLALEKSRKKKNQDKDKIMDLEGQIADLRNEIKNSTKEIVNDLLGISSVGDAAEQAVASMIEAYKNGEDYMKVFEDSFEDMIDNMIVKAIAGRVIGDKIQAMFDAVKKATTDRADNTLYGNSGMTYAEAIQREEARVAAFKKYGDMAQADAAQKVLNQMLKEYEDIARTTPTDLARAKANVQSWRDEVNRDFLSYMDLYGIKPETADKQLSALQQGIQGITEDTAGALEAITNGMLQQSYLQSDLLTQIRDTILEFNLDVQMGVLSEILLQLQSSYQIQMSIRDTLRGWSNASGMAVRVEMV